MNSKTKPFAESQKPQNIPSAKVLLVDEDLGDLEYEFGLIHNQGHNVFACPSFAAAAQLVESEAFDCAVLSQGGPAFASRPLLESLLAEGHQTPALVLADCVDIPTYLEAMKLGAQDYLPKPFRERDLLGAIEALVRSQKGAVC
jgi:two-component system, OmpR family, phosphate regulon response regulator OmpR